MSRSALLLLCGALLVGLGARAPGIWWGANFPPEWWGHHPDEYTHVLHTQLLLNRYPPSPEQAESNRIGLRSPWEAGYAATPYPKGMAVHVAVPAKVLSVLTGNRGAAPPPSSELIPLGRLISVLYGCATILVVFVLGWRLSGRQDVGLLSAWIMALGGLHVAQSHFFLADVPALFWTLLGLLLLWDDLSETNPKRQEALAAAAFCFGVAFGLKIWVAAFPSLGLAALVRARPVWRVALAGAFSYLGFSLVNLGLYNIYDLLDTLASGYSDPYLFSKLSSILLYIVELPALVSFPVVLAALVGMVLAIKALADFARPLARGRLILVVFLPLVIQAGLVVFQLDHFPRHLLPFIPWLSMAAAFGLVSLGDKLSTPRARLILYGAVVLYLAVFVYDGEKGFIAEPRNRAAEWLAANVPQGRTLWWYYHSIPGYERAGFPQQRPDVVIEEMLHANHYLSGMGLRDSYPEDYRYVFDITSQEELEAFQSLFKGESEYVEAARFDEGYFMPEYRLVNRLIGNRSSNYLSGVAIFLNSNTMDVRQVR